MHDDAAFMRRALELAHLGRGAVHPNPMVGAVVVRDGAVVGEGFHARYGGPHAEVEALRAAGAAARGATLYVSLEPCAHVGRTPPCTDAILAAGVTRVVYAAGDPNPKAAGGADVLRRAGVPADGGVENRAARSVNAAFFHAHERSGPFVALKLAVSLDGAIAAAPGVRTQLTGPDARRLTHRLRAGHDAVLIGSGTAAIDDPLLNVRCAETHRQPLRVILDTRAALRPDSRLVETAAEAPVLVVCGDDAPADRREALRDAGVETLAVPRAAGGVSLAHTFAALHHRGVASVLVEGGATLGAALLREQLVHRIYLFVAPRFLGDGGVPAFPGVGPLSGWRCVRAELTGDDALLSLDPATES